MSVTELIIAAIVVSLLSYWCGRLRQHAAMFDKLQSQQERGDYWFEQYRAATKENWETHE
jgi:membrane protein DedA with SNARE-associated domain